jgi:paraquat-inducible protein B
MNGQKGESKARLGVFVVCGLVLAVAGILALGAQRYFERTLPMHCYFQESVQGLERGSPISYRGVQVGRVDQILMRRPEGGPGMPMGTQALIEVRCELFANQLGRGGGFGPSDEELAQGIRDEVDQGLRVRIAWKDITGQKYLDLDDLDREEHRLPNLGFEPAQPYIPTASERSLTDIQRDVATTIGGLAKIDYPAVVAQLQVVLEQLSQKISEFQAGALSASFQDAAKAVAETARNEDLHRGLGRMDEVTAEIEKLAKRANEVLAKPELEQGITDLAAAAKSLRETADGLAKGVPETLGRLDATMAEARQAIADAKLGETTSAVRDGVAEVGGAARSAAALQVDVGAALRELSSASRALARLAEYLERHPDALLRGRAPAGALGDGGKR